VPFAVEMVRAGETERARGRRRVLGPVAVRGHVGRGRCGLWAGGARPATSDDGGANSTNQSQIRKCAEGERQFTI